MANFATHLGVGTIASGMAATLAVATEMIGQGDIIALALAGALGSVLPDIDLKDSRSSRIIFFALGLFLSFVVLFSVVSRYSIAELWIIWIGSFLLVRYVGHYMFHNFAVHRGVFHSVLAAVFWLLLTAAIFYHGLRADPRICWLAGIFMFFGYVVHLLLDEVYSVDFNGNRVKRSFGTALKLIEYRNVAASLTMALVAFGVYFLTPPFWSFYEVVAVADIWQELWDKLLPDQNWFGIELNRGHAAAPADTLLRPPAAVPEDVTGGVR